MHKTKRQQKIISLINARRIGTQQELTALLERAGFVATQPSVSRDLVELGVVKSNGHYTLPRATYGASKRGLLGLETAGDALVVAKCEPGLASAVAVEIDRAGIVEIVGTLAGEDTVFIAVQERKAQRAVVKKVLELFG
jgi:transcriptional regulator of arginine metabolism